MCFVVLRSCGVISDKCPLKKNSLNPKKIEIVRARVHRERLCQPLVLRSVFCNWEQLSMVADDCVSRSAGLRRGKLKLG